MALNIVINDVSCSAEAGETLLAVARRNHIYIPTLCHSDALPGQGCCRVCMTEIDEGPGPRLVAACVYRLVSDAVVRTDSPKVLQVRKINLALLRAMAPESVEVRAMCQTYQVEEKPSYQLAAGEKCIMCGLCARACALNGTNAISTIGRGVKKSVSTFYEQASPDCIGCGSCAAVCPTGAIELTQTEDKRQIWHKEFDLVRCADCGRPFATREELAYNQARTEAKEEIVLCDSCRKARLAKNIKKIITKGNFEQN